MKTIVGIGAIVVLVVLIWAGFIFVLSFAWNYVAAKFGLPQTGFFVTAVVVFVVGTIGRLLFPKLDAS